MNGMRLPLALSLCASLTVMAWSWDVGAYDPGSAGGALGLRHRPPPVLDVRGASATFDVGQEAGVRVVARNLPARPSFSLVSGDLPPGLSFTGDGRFTGTFEAPGSYGVTVATTDGAGNRSTVPVAFVVLPAPPALTVSFGEGLPEPGRAFVAEVRAPANSGIIDWALDNGPAWVSVKGDGDKAVVRGTVPADAKDLAFTVAATDGRGRVFYAGSGEMSLEPAIVDVREGAAVGSASAVEGAAKP